MYHVPDTTLFGRMSGGGGGTGGRGLVGGLGTVRADPATTLGGRNEAKGVQVLHREYSVDKSSMQRNITTHHQDEGKVVVNSFLSQNKWEPVQTFITNLPSM